MSKPDWKDAPEWANWIAQDSCGSWWWYECKPMVREFMREGWWHAIAGTGRVRCGRGSASEEWSETLERRP